MTKPIAEQCAERGIEVPTGLTAGELRARGFDIPERVPEDFVLATQLAGAPVNVHEFGRVTGYVWEPTREAEERMASERGALFREVLAKLGPPRPRKRVSN